ncbi:hypothetical protein BGZ65_001785 [Modicella reniformis]|uniref:Cytochrome P450 n=1 Tax=Modicella reniformis TaxID=1440133 RepID=A0A9P6M9Y1_9FUNG|nr:hypothetical protein BGZ65_001785 [Modicella reniformis]
MVGMSSSPAAPTIVNILRIAVPIGVGLASALYIKANFPKLLGISGFSKDKSIPMVPVRAGDSTHDAEYNEDPAFFLAKCEKNYGHVFNLKIFYLNLTCVTGVGLIREVYTNENVSFKDHLDDLTGLRAFMAGLTKSNKGADGRTIHDVIKYGISNQMDWLGRGLNDKMAIVMDEHLGFCQETVVKNVPEQVGLIIASALADIFMGPKAAQDPAILEAFIHCASDFGQLLMHGYIKNFWAIVTAKLNYNVLNPLTKYVQTLTKVAISIMEERRQEEVERGEEYERPKDILQNMMDNLDLYNLVDLEDACGHILLLALGSVHTTGEACTNMLYFLGAHPEYIEPMYQEQTEILDEQEKEHQEKRQAKLASGEVPSMDAFVGTDLDPKEDRAITNKAVKKMNKMDSIFRETMRYQMPPIMGTHKANEDLTLSNGMTITKGTRVTCNGWSVHQTEETQGEDPTEFRPFRFVGKNKTATKAGPDFLPFGLGRHICPGRFLAIQDMKIFGALIVGRYCKIEILEKEKTKQMLQNRLGTTPPSPLIFTSRPGVKLCPPAAMVL